MDGAKSFSEQLHETLVKSNAHLPLATLVANWRYCDLRSQDFLNLSMGQMSSLESQKEALNYLIRTRISV